MKYHLTEAGPKKCSATKRACQYGSDSHFNTEAEAYQNFEKIMESGDKTKLFSVNKRNKLAYIEKYKNFLKNANPNLSEDFIQKQAEQAAEDKTLVAKNPPVKPYLPEGNIKQAEKVVKQINQNLDEIEFLNHTENGSGKNYVSLAEMKDPDLAANNCAAAAWAIEENFSTADATIRTKTLIMSDDTTHYINVLDNGNVIDYTFRQFDKDADFPVVATNFEEYEEKLSEAAQEKYHIVFKKVVENE